MVKMLFWNKITGYQCLIGHGSCSQINIPFPSCLINSYLTRPGLNTVKVVKPGILSLIVWLESQPWFYHPTDNIGLRRQKFPSVHYVTVVFKSWNIILVSHHIRRTEVCRILPSDSRELRNMIEGDKAASRPLSTSAVNVIATPLIKHAQNCQSL